MHNVHEHQSQFAQQQPAAPDLTEDFDLFSIRTSELGPVDEPALSKLGAPGLAHLIYS